MSGTHQSTSTCQVALLLFLLPFLLPLLLPRSLLQLHKLPPARLEEENEEAQVGAPLSVGVSPCELSRSVASMLTALSRWQAFPQPFPPSRNSAYRRGVNGECLNPAALHAPTVHDTQSSFPHACVSWGNRQVGSDRIVQCSKCGSGATCTVTALSNRVPPTVACLQPCVSELATADSISHPTMTITVIHVSVCFAVACVCRSSSACWLC
jgi:hypothetical protein